MKIITWETYNFHKQQELELTGILPTQQNFSGEFEYKELPPKDGRSVKEKVTDAKNTAVSAVKKANTTVRDAIAGKKGRALQDKFNAVGKVSEKDMIDRAQAQHKAMLNSYSALLTEKKKAESEGRHTDAKDINEALSLAKKALNAYREKNYDALNGITNKALKDERARATGEAKHGASVWTRFRAHLARNLGKYVLGGALGSTMAVKETIPIYTVTLDDDDDAEVPPSTANEIPRSTIAKGPSTAEEKRPSTAEEKRPSTVTVSKQNDSTAAKISRGIRSGVLGVAIGYGAYKLYKHLNQTALSADKFYVIDPSDKPQKGFLAGSKSGYGTRAEAAKFAAADQVVLTGTEAITKFPKSFKPR